MSQRASPDPLVELALDPSTKARLRAYLDLLERWAERVNLTGARSDEARVRLLIAPALMASPYIQPGHVLDIGSGNGSPGLVLAAMHAECAFTLLEPRQRRWAFLREAARAIGRPEIAVLRERFEEHEGPAADTVTVRALRLPLASAVRLVRPGGRVVVLGARPERDRRFEERGGTPHDLHVFERTE